MENHNREATKKGAWMVHYSTRKKEFCYLRSIATIAIVVLHTFYALALSNEHSGVRTVTVLNQIVNTQMWAVPVFLMVTGSLLLPAEKEITYRNLFLKKILRIILAILIFTGVYEAVDILIFNQPQEKSFILDWLYKVYTGTTWSPMWYMYMLIGIYFLLPAYKAVIKTFGDKEIIYLLAIYTVFMSILPLVSVAFVKSGFYIHQLTIYPFYLFAGYALNRELIKIKLWISISMFLGVAGIIEILTYLRWCEGMERLDALWGYSSPLIILQSIAMFAIVKSILGYGKDKKEETNKRKFLDSLIIKFDNCSFGIYLVHIIFVKILVQKNGAFLSKYIGIVGSGFVIVLIATCISYISVELLKKIKPVNALL